jgi:hypothetical protein
MKRAITPTKIDAARFEREPHVATVSSITKAAQRVRYPFLY